MRTVGQLSKLTGISRRTIQYYAHEKEPSKSGKGAEAKTRMGSEGAGILTPCHTGENGYMYFDDDALLLLLAIKTFKQCGYDQRKTREVIEAEDFDFESSIDAQLEALENAKREIDQQIEFLSFLKAAVAADYDDDENQETLAAVMSLFMKMLFISIEQVVRKDIPDFKLDFQDPGVVEALKNSTGKSRAALIEPILEVMGHVGKGELALAAESLPPIMKMDDDDIPEDKLIRATSKLEEMFDAKTSPKDKEAQQQAALLLQEMFQVKTLQELEVANYFMSGLMEGTYAAILMELFIGEGFAEYVAKACDAYRTSVRRQIEKKEKQKTSSESGAPQEANPDAAT